MIASLPMYAWPELVDAHDRYWELIRHELEAVGIPAPERLSQNFDESEPWTNPDLVLSQTCGLPYRTRLHDRVTLVGTPDFGVPGCESGYYRSVIVVHGDDARDQLHQFREAVFAYNGTGSQSGYAAMYEHVAALGFWFTERLHTGSHAASVRAVAEGSADIASIDAVSWAFITRYDERAASLRILDLTEPTPGLPYITARGADAEATFQAVEAAIANLGEVDREALGIRGLVRIPKSAYLAVPNLPPTDSPPVSDSLPARIAGRALTYLTHPPRGDDPVVVHADPDDLRARFSTVAPLEFGDDEPGLGDDAIVAAVDLIIEHSVHTSHPRFINQNFAGPDPVAVVGDWLGAALNTTGATFEAAPVFTLMESAVLSKLARIAGYTGSGAPSLPPLAPGLFCPGGSTATLYALQLARHRLRPDVKRSGMTGERLVVFVSDAGHYSATKSAALLGLGSEAVVKVASDDEGALSIRALDAAIKSANASGATPLAVIATAGTTVTSAFDDLEAIADLCQQHEIWLHVDGCYGGSALFSANERHRLAGVDRSDSFVWNLHKMMGMTQQCTALLVREPERLADCFALGADYLFQPDKLHADYDSGDRTFQCARRIDVLKLWLAWKHHGDHGFAQRVDHAVAMADHARARIVASDGAFIPLAGSFTNLVFAWIPPTLRSAVRSAADLASLSDDQHRLLHHLPPVIKARMQQEGTAMVGFQPMGGLNTFRFLFMNPEVTTADVDALVDLIATYGTEALADLHNTVLDSTARLA